MSEHTYTIPIIGGLLTVVGVMASTLWVNLTRRVSVSDQKIVILDEKVAALDVKFTRHAAESTTQQKDMNDKLAILLYSIDNKHYRSQDSRTREGEF